jgi:demethylmenaquinone methyltransferase/2-methoxy-6-polyprenyl-1,4-benzoquinol methylase/phosphoethanolamine N-methyltransferase
LDDVADGDRVIAFFSYQLDERFAQQMAGALAAPIFFIVHGILLRFRTFFDFCPITDILAGLMVDLHEPQLYNRDIQGDQDMPHHSHSHAVEQPARTEGSLIRWAAHYDLFTKFLTLGQAARLRKLTVANALIQPGDGVLDVGCGTGEVTLLAKIYAKDGKVYGIDPAPEMISVARRKAAQKKLTIDFRVGVIEALPFPNESIDVVTSSLMMHHLPENLKKRGLAEIYRVLKPGGRLLVADFMRPSKSLFNHLFMIFSHHQGLETGIEDLQKMFREAGFAQVTKLEDQVLVIGFVRAVK